MAGNLFTVTTEADSLTATTAKTVLGIKAAANQCVKVYGMTISFDSVDVTKAPALIEIGTCTFASNAIGTNSTTITGRTTNGRSETVQTTCGKTWTSEPTVITVIRAFNVPTFMGLASIYLPFSKEIFVPGAGGLVLRITSPVSCNFTGGLDCEE